jgi:hypothetical protein
VTEPDNVPSRLALVWLAAWPLWSLAIFAGLALVRLLPAGYPRAVAAVPILLLVPGSVTLGALFHPQRRPRGITFACYATLLGAVWTAFASLLLYLQGVLITAGSTYLCLLIICAVLALAAQARLVLGSPGRGRRAAREPAAADSFYAERNDAQAPVSRGAGLYCAAAVVAGVCLLGGGLYAYDHHPQPAAAGYTMLDWAGLPPTGNVTISAAGARLGFQIVRHGPGTGTYLLSAAWLGSPPRPLAAPVTVRVGSGRTYRGALFVPSPPDGCIYRIEMTLTAARQSDPLTRQPQSWSLDADVRDPSKPSKKCT